MALGHRRSQSGRFLTGYLPPEDELERVWRGRSVLVTAHSASRARVDRYDASVRRLFILPPSPWSERARWALDHHALRYETVEHLPFVREGQLRRLLGNRERVTVPLLTADGSAYGDSWDIAVYADREGAREKLMPAELEGKVREWNQVAESGMGGLRMRVLQKMLESPKALDASSPSFMPTWIRPLARPAARWTIRRLQRKYQTRSEEAATYTMQLRAALDRLREGLKSSKPYLLGRFTYADIVMATLIQGVLPVSDLYWRLPPAIRDVWTEESLAREYGDLIAWRDDMYERHRQQSQAN